MSTQSPDGAKIPATMTVRRAIEVAVLCTTSLELYLRLVEVHKLLTQHCLKGSRFQLQSLDVLKV